MKKFILSLAALMAVTAVSAQDDPEKVNGQVSAAAPSTELSSLQLASDLVQYGIKQKSPISLIDAMNIIVNTPTQTSTDQKEGENADSKDGVTILNFNEIASKAREYSDNDATMLALIQQMEDQYGNGSRGASGGPRSKVDVVRGNTTDVYNITFVAGRLAEVGVIGDGDTDLDLYVYDNNGNLIASDTDYTDDCYVSWTPRWTGNFKIKIVNRGSISNRYLLITN